jgi:hypothetical protein
MCVLSFSSFSISAYQFTVHVSFNAAQSHEGLYIFQWRDNSRWQHDSSPVSHTFRFRSCFNHEVSRSWCMNAEILCQCRQFRWVQVRKDAEWGRNGEQTPDHILGSQLYAIRARSSRLVGSNITSFDRSWSKALQPRSVPRCYWTQSYACSYFVKLRRANGEWWTPSKPGCRIQNYPRSHCKRHVPQADVIWGALST